jgi:vacuolar-type H+-ATPase subunit H
MAKSANESQFHNDEFTRIFDEYRAKIEEITQRTEKSLQSINVAPAAANHGITVDVEDEKPEETISQVQPEPDKKPIEVIWPSEKESVEVIKEAKRKAQQLIAEAEASIKREARKKTRAQVDKIIGNAKKEAEDIITKAQQAAEKERNDAIATSKSEAEQLLRDITEKCRQETREESSRVIAVAREKAEKIIDDITTSSREINHIITQIVNRARKTISEFEESLQEETADLTKAITEAQKKLEQVTMMGREEETAPVLPVKSKESRECYKNPTLAVRLIGEKSNGRHGHQALFSGQMEMKSSSAVDYQYLRNLKKHLVHIPAIKYLQEYASEKEMSVLFDVKEPLPLLEILTNMPTVDKVIAETDDDICIIFKGSL